MKPWMPVHPSIQLQFDIVIVRVRIHQNDIWCRSSVRLHISEASQEMALHLHDSLSEVVITEVTAQRQCPADAWQARPQ